MLRACDRRRAAGRRDYAVIVLMLRLGLRASEVATLRLDDLDWRAGQLTVHGKGSRVDQLPLPVDVGEAIAAYLCRGRPRSATVREVFLRVQPPQVGLTRGGVKAIVVGAARRAGLGVVRPHRLRHTAATDMLRAGAVAGRDRPGAATPLARLHRRLRQGRRRAAAHDCAALAGGGGDRERRWPSISMTTCGCVAGWAFSSAATARCCHGSSPTSRPVERRRSPSSWRSPGRALPEGIKPITVDFRLSAVRGFARYLHAIDPGPRDPTAWAAARSRGGGRRPTSTRQTRSPRCCVATRRLRAAAAGRHLSGAARAAGRDRHARSARRWR